jgi:putative membrane protein insertion efficiency factor
MLRKLLIFPIRLYQKFISPNLPRTCRYYPTCSRYAIEAIEKHGAVKGLILAVWRLLRCNPFSKGGYDPVPEPRKRKKSR